MGFMGFGIDMSRLTQARGLKQTHIHVLSQFGAGRASRRRADRNECWADIPFLAKRRTFTAEQAVRTCAVPYWRGWAFCLTPSNSMGLIGLRLGDRGQIAFLNFTVLANVLEFDDFSR